ncbi:MAG: relaxase/mobilization nuclease domain-containing protein [Sporichthyaceae bacterium]
MIPNVTKGGDITALMRYLAGKGKANEHTNPHVISGDAFLVAWHGAEELDRAGAGEIADYLDAPRVEYGIEMRAQVTEQDPATGAKVVRGYKKQDVWHCSLSIRAEEGPLSEELWDRVAREFMDEMGFTEASGKAPCRWVGIHHGTSANGNDHIHIAASMVREDGTRWAGQRSIDPGTGRLVGDFQKAQAVCRALEAKHGLEVIDGRGRGASERGVKPAQQARADRAELAVPEKADLAARLRRAAVASTSEAEWIRRVRADGVVVKPRYAANSTDVITGYKAGLRTNPTGRAAGEKLVLYGGGSLADDLSLPRLRENWPDPTIEAAGEACAEWQAAFRGQPPVHAQGRETRALGARAGDTAAVNLSAFNDRLTAVPITDHAAWADAARDASAALSAWARYDPENAGELGRAAAALGRSAQLQRPAGTTRRRVKESAMGTALVFMSARRDDRPKIAGMILMQQILRTAVALRDYQAARANSREAQRIHTEVITRLQRLQHEGHLAGYSQAPVLELAVGADRAALQARQVATTGWEPTAPGTGPDIGTGTVDGSPLPNPLAPRREHGAPTRGGRPGQDKGTGRDSDGQSR